jgi:hypothetical protein
MLGPAPYWLPVIIPETTFPPEITRAHLAHISQLILLSFVCASIYNKAFFLSVWKLEHLMLDASAAIVCLGEKSVSGQVSCDILQNNYYVVGGGR